MSASAAALRAVVCRLASVLLQYPSLEQEEAFDEIARAASQLPEPRVRAALVRFVADLRAAPLLARQEEYVRTFDFHQRASLYLTYHLHGDQRTRGMALLRLKRLYEAAGLPYTGSELPDYLPAVLEFAAFAAAAHGARVLEELRLAIELVRAALRGQRSPYAALLDAVCATLPALDRDQTEALRRLASEGPRSEKVGLEPFAPLDVMPSEANGATR